MYLIWIITSAYLWDTFHLIVKDFHGLLSPFHLHQKRIPHMFVVYDSDDLPPIRIRCMYLLLSWITFSWYIMVRPSTTNLGQQRNYGLCIPWCTPYLHVLHLPIMCVIHIITAYQPMMYSISARFAYTGNVCYPRIHGIPSHDVPHICFVLHIPVMCVNLVFPQYQSHNCDTIHPIREPDISVASQSMQWLRDQGRVRPL